SRQFSANGQLLRNYNDNLLGIALAWNASGNPSEKKELEEMYVAMTEHLLDQGFAAGSGQGTLHHLGYSMRNFYTAPVIMRDVLAGAGLLSQVQQAMEWFSGVGEVKTAPQEDGMDIDAFNTSLMGRVASLLMLEDGPRKQAYMEALSRWIDNGFKYAEGTLPCFKRDGCVYHHRKNYPAYATGGFDGAVNAVYMLSGTAFAISREGHQVLKDALLEMRFYCNKASFPLAQSGRHPDGKGALIPRQYGLLALAGSPDGNEVVDRELAGAYLRLEGADGKYSETFTDAGIEPEAAPTGTHIYGYNASLAHRSGEWLVTVAGHSRYLWSAEIYQGANHYGRYLTHGSLQILADEEPDIDSFGSGYAVDGWDWCHIPGTTAAVIPMEQMKANVLNVDEFSGYEEMLLSDEWFAGGVSHKGGSGAYAMKLHEHDKYNGSLRARKSFFLFGNRIIALGSNIENHLEGAPVHTTLFQNTASEDGTTVLDEMTLTGTVRATSPLKEKTVLRDRFGNAYFVRNGEVLVSRQLQHSLHEETDRPTTGFYEKAAIVHDGGNSYEYMILVHPSESQVADCEETQPYSADRCDSRVHSVTDLVDGTKACAVFEQGDVDSLVLSATPSMLMYSTDSEGRLTLSVSNPDLALYEGPSDEVFDKDGKRVERSVYGRKWIDNPCGRTSVSLVLDGEWELEGLLTRSAQGGPKTQTDIRTEGGKTFIEVVTAEARTEELALRRKD
ncbi:MAG: chondroitinase family polysaccharide lyase, partial [Candidatus Cryptobacteroides sp.]